MIYKNKCKQNKPCRFFYLEGPGCSSTAVSQAQADFVVFLQDLKRSLFPLGGAQVHAVESDLYCTTTGQFGHEGRHGLWSQRRTARRFLEAEEGLC